MHVETNVWRLVLRVKWQKLRRETLGREFLGYPVLELNSEPQVIWKGMPPQESRVGVDCGLDCQSLP